MMRFKRALTICFCCFITTAGCAAERVGLRIDTSGIISSRPLVWPEYPEKPRYRYIGQLTGEKNFVRQSEMSQPESFLRWVAGFVSGKKGLITLQRPQSGAVDAQGRIYVTDISRQAVYVFDNVDGKLRVWEMAEPFIMFKSPIGVALNEKGEVFVSDSELGYVARLDSKGIPLGTIGKQELIRPTGIAWDHSTGMLFVADTYAHDIKVFDDKGALIRIIGKRGEGKEGLNFPTYLAYAKGKLYVSDSLNARVQVFSAGGEYVGGFGKRGLYVGNFTHPKGISVDSYGNIYVVESYYDYILIFNQKGQFLLPIGGSGSKPGKLYLPAGIWTDKSGRVFVADMFNRRVIIFQYIGASNGKTNGS